MVANKEKTDKKTEKHKKDPNLRPRRHICRSCGAFACSRMLLSFICSFYLQGSPDCTMSRCLSKSAANCRAECERDLDERRAQVLLSLTRRRMICEQNTVGVDKLRHTHRRDHMKHIKEVRRLGGKAFMETFWL